MGLRAQGLASKLLPIMKNQLQKNIEHDMETGLHVSTSM